MFIVLMIVLSWYVFGYLLCLISYIALERNIKAKYFVESIYPALYSPLIAIFVLFCFIAISIGLLIEEWLNDPNWKQ